MDSALLPWFTVTLLWHQVLRDIWKKEIKCPYDSLGVHPLAWLTRWALDKSGDFLEPRCPSVYAVNLGGDEGLPPPYLVTGVSDVISSLWAPGSESCWAGIETQTQRTDLWTQEGKEREGWMERVALIYVHFHV